MDKIIKPMTLTGKISIPFSYAAGEAASKFFEGLKAGKIIGSRCAGCGRVLVPARSFCSTCYISTYDYVEVNAFGRLVTWTELFSESGNHSGYGIIKLDGASTGFVHKLKVGNGDNFKIGLKMEAVFSEKRTGSLDDILYFKPANSEGV